MKNKVLALIILTSINVFSQEKRKMFQNEFAPFTIQCEKIGRLLIDKTAESNLLNWYEGLKTEQLIAELSAFELDIDNSEVKVTYYLSLLREKPLFYTFDFRNSENGEPFGQLYISFINRDNILVDNIKFVTKKKMEEIELESDTVFELPDIPLPPKPPAKKN